MENKPFPSETIIPDKVQPFEEKNLSQNVIQDFADIPAVTVSII